MRLLWVYTHPLCTRRWNTLHCTETHYNTLKHTAAHCSTLQHTATHCNTLQHTQILARHKDARRRDDATHYNALKHTTAHWNTLQHTATHSDTRSTQACTKMRWCNALQHTKIHCNSLQHTATHCNALQLTQILIWHKDARRRDDATIRVRAHGSRASDWCRCEPFPLSRNI